MSETTKRKKKNVGKKTLEDGRATRSSKRSVEDETEDASPKKKARAGQEDSVHERVVIEHCMGCQTFRRRADERVAALKSAFPQLEFTFNPTKPRRGAFEFVAVSSDGEETVIWSGLKKGPPRKLKFLDPDLLVKLFNDYFNGKKKK